MRENANVRDVRVQRSRRDLMNALESLLPEKSFDDITVKDITDRALVSKNTFYNNFKDKEELLEYLHPTGSYPCPISPMEIISNLIYALLQQAIQRPA